MTVPNRLAPDAATFAAARAPELTTREEWERRIRAIQPGALGIEPFGAVLLRHLPAEPAWTAIEIGAIPGRFLLFLHQAFGYRISALDYARDWTAFDEVMRRGRVPEVQKLEADFLCFESPRQYDVVASFGFIEHFLDVADVIRRHTRLVGPEGFLVLSVPNFTRLQYGFHWVVDRANLKLHNTQAMDPRRIEQWVVRDGFRICYSGYLGRPEFWHEAQELAWWQRIVARIARSLAQRLGPRLPASSWYSPYYMVIARRDTRP